MWSLDFNDDENYTAERLILMYDICYHKYYNLQAGYVFGHYESICGGSISEGEYSFHFGITSFTINNTVNIIGKNAFLCCFRLTSITIPDSVTFIGEDAFKECNSLTSVTIPDSVTSIGDEAFDECTNLTSITIPESVTFIGEDAFYECDKLTIEFDWIEFKEELFFSENISHLPRTLTFKTLGGDKYKITIPPDTRREDFEEVSLDLLSKGMEESVENLELHGLVVLYK